MKQKKEKINLDTRNNLKAPNYEGGNDVEILLDDAGTVRINGIDHSPQEFHQRSERITADAHIDAAIPFISAAAKAHRSIDYCLTRNWKGCSKGLIPKKAIAVILLELEESLEPVGGLEGKLSVASKAWLQKAKDWNQEK